MDNQKKHLNGILYTMSYCPFCITVENFLNSNNISVKKIDITFNDHAKHFLVTLGGGKPRSLAM